jgi:hypothetical protein
MNSYEQVTQEVKDAFDALCKGRVKAAVEAERERIIAANAPEIERCNAYIKALEASVLAEREACAQVVEEYPHWLGMTAKAEIANAIRDRGNA